MSLKKWMKTQIRRAQLGESGQGMTEYIIIVALVAMLSIGFISAFGDNIRILFAASTNALAGQDSVSVDAMKKPATTSDRTVKDFDQYNKAP